MILNQLKSTYLKWSEVLSSHDYLVLRHSWLWFNFEFVRVNRINSYVINHFYAIQRQLYLHWASFNHKFIWVFFLNLAEVRDKSKRLLLCVPVLPSLVSRIRRWATLLLQTPRRNAVLLRGAPVQYRSCYSTHLKLEEEFLLVDSFSVCYHVT